MLVELPHARDILLFGIIEFRCALSIRENTACQRMLLPCYRSLLLPFPCTYRAKHPVKVHVWAGISMRGRTGICIFEGIMKKELYIEILSRTLVSFIQDVYPESHRFMADNDPKHTSGAAQEFLDRTGIFWCRTPAESPDLNPIENMWHELKEFL